jgi:penicillin-binding protein 2
MRDDTKYAATKMAVFQYITVGVFFFLLTGYWDLQVRNPDLYNEKAERNWIRSQPLPAPRGKILDRDGRVMVDNVSSYRLLLSRDNLRDEHIAPIAYGINIDPNDLAGKLRRMSRRPRYESITLKDSLGEGELAFVESHRGSDTFPELELVKSHQRLYPQDGFLAHLIGYTGEVNEQELNSPEFAKYNPGDIVGKFGIERFYNDHLTGKDGSRQVKVDNTGFEREVLGIKEATPGKDLRLTIDLDLQSVAELAMDGRQGAVVALDPRNGEVLAMVSRPAFDSNHFVGRVDPREFSRLLTDPAKPFINRATQAQLSPGSTFKPLMALAALEEGVIDENFTVNCGGSANWYGRTFKCWRAHGPISLHRAIVYSCDVFFYAVGNKLGIDNIAKYGEMAGLGRKTGVDLPQEKEGDMPSSSWKIRKFREKWYAGETISVSIGQGYLTVTPLQLAQAIGGIATGGIWMKPHLVKDTAPKEPSRRENLNLDNVSKVVSGMYGVVNEGGTAAAAYVPTISICGKTGTSQTASNDYIKAERAKGNIIKDNAWFISFAPRESPEIVVVVLFEEGMHGDRAAPIARDVIKAYFDKKARATLPAPVAKVLDFRSPVERPQ